jgi:HSP90 family molecular chaperone
MAKQTFTSAEEKEAVKRIRAKLSKRNLKKFDALSSEEQEEVAGKFLAKFGKRNKVGAIDWEAFTKFLVTILNLLLPLFMKKS